MCIVLDGIHQTQQSMKQDQSWKISQKAAINSYKEETPRGLVRLQLRVQIGCGEGLNT